MYEDYIQDDQSEKYNVRRTRSQNVKRGNFDYKKAREEVKNKIRELDTRIAWWKNKPKVKSRHTKLKIDSKLNKVPKFRSYTQQKIDMIKKYNPLGNLPSKEFFIPRFKVKKHPQMNIIQQYFVSKIFIQRENVILNIFRIYL